MYLCRVEVLPATFFAVVSNTSKEPCTFLILLFCILLLITKNTFFARVCYNSALRPRRHSGGVLLYSCTAKGSNQPSNRLRLE